MYRSLFKRLIDLLMSITGLIVLFPVILIVAIVMLIANMGNPFFFQERPGKNEKVFKLIKFRSMTNKKDKDGKLLPDEERLTKFGNFIRKASLDELPQLLNVIKGDMSVVGPRPLRVHYLPYYTKRESMRHTVRPGITGLAQVSGRNEVGWDEKLEFDAKYVDNITLLNDISIIYKTFLKVIKPSDVIMDDSMQTFDEYRSQQLEQK